MESKYALLTGASSGIGRAIARILPELGYTVFGIGRSFPQDMPPSPSFHPVCLDLTKTKELAARIRALRKEISFFLLINNAGVGYFGPHEELNPEKIHEMTTVNLEVPMLLAQLLLRDLKKNGGMMINISSVTAKKSSPHGCAYGATKAALTAFSASLFDEVRKYGVRVAAVHPDMTRTRFYRNADFTADPAEDASLSAQEVASAVRFLLTAPPDCAVTDITLQPQKHRILRQSARQTKK